MVKDPFHAICLPVHIGTLVELGKANGKLKIYHDWKKMKIFYLLWSTWLSYCFFSSTELFYLSHKLVDLYPNNPVSPV